MRILVTTAALLAMAGSGWAATLKVPQQYGTIQEAVDAASDGDTIKVSPGVYRENVVVPGIDNLRILGKKAVWDGNLSGDVGICLTASGDGLVVQGFRFRNGYRGISVEGNGTVVQKCVFTNCWDYAANIYGNDTVFTKNTVFSCYRGLYVNGDDARADKSTFRETYYTHLEISGNRALATKNKHVGFWDEGTVTVFVGSDSTISNNLIKNTYGTCIGVGGMGCTVSGNNLRTSYGGVYLEGNGNTVEGNTGRSFYYYMIQVYGNGNVVDRNDLAGSYYSGVSLNGDDNEATGNEISLVTDDRGIDAAGNGTLVEGNTIFEVYGPAIESEGVNVTVRNNRVSDVWGDAGIAVATGENTPAPILVEGNTVSEGPYYGIHVDADMATVRNNTVSWCGAHYYGNFWVNGTGNTLEDCESEGGAGNGFYFNGTGGTITDCRTQGDALNGFLVYGSGHTMTGCSSRNGDGQGLMNYSTGLTVNSSVFLDNALDVANQGTVTNGDAGMTYETGGIEQGRVYWNWD